MFSAALGASSIPVGTTFILSSAKLDACGQRWLASLANYNFRLFYKTGKRNIEADALSRIPREEYHELESPVQLY